MKKAALIGNPNSGKTTLFNRLTGSRQHTGNWAGVTVEKKEGIFTLAGEEAALVDLPGIYSLSPDTLEERVALEYLWQERPDVILDILDATNLERNLYLTLQLMELGIPVVAAVNMADELKSQGRILTEAVLEQQLGIPVVLISAKTGEGVERLTERMARALSAGAPGDRVRYDPATQTALERTASTLPEQPGRRFLAAKLLAGEEISFLTGAAAGGEVTRRQIRQAYQTQTGQPDCYLALADARYRWIEKAVRKALSRPAAGDAPSPSDRIDRVVTSRVLAIPLFLALMAGMFALTFGPVGSSLKGMMEALFFRLGEWAARLLAGLNTPAWAVDLIEEGILGGIGGVLAFLPQIGMLFFFLSLLEDSGYMARAAFLMDRLFRRFGLSGKSFIPMLMGFGCTTPGVMAARTAGSRAEQRLTVMLVPFLSCGARLPIYLLMAGIFFPRHAGAVLLGLYGLGMAVAVLSGLFLKNTLFRSTRAGYLLELPPYRWPSVGFALLSAWDRCKGFLYKAATVIFAMNTVIWVLQHLTPALAPAAAEEESLFCLIGSALAPLFEPLGFGFWQAAAALLAGLIAKEGVAATMLVLFGGQAAIAAAFTPLSALSFLVFCALYTPCVAAVATIRKEMGSTALAAFSLCYQTLTAYGVAFLVYQGGRLLGF